MPKPDVTVQFLRRAKKRAVLAGAPGNTAARRIAAYLRSAPADEVPPAVRAAVNAEFPEVVNEEFPDGVPVGMGPLRHVVAPLLRTAEVGQYAVDRELNPQLTEVLKRNPLIQRVRTGTLHAEVPQMRGELPAAGRIPIGGHDGLNAHTDDRVLEAAAVFNSLTDGPALPPIRVHPMLLAPHAAMTQEGRLDLGWAASRGNLVHEFGHHLENNLSPKDFATLHNFLRARTRDVAEDRQMHRVGYFFENHPGYRIDMPEINAGGLASRKDAESGPARVRRVMEAPVVGSVQVAYRAQQATPLRYLRLGLVNAPAQQLGRAASALTGRREFRNWGGNSVDDFFVFNANNPRLSYSSTVHDFDPDEVGNVNWDFGDTTEYLSTTVELFNHPSHAREVVKRDPLRVALFLYLANRPQYNAVRDEFFWDTGQDLNDLIHTVE